MSEALRVAEELITDVELQRLRPSEVILKASRVARLTDNDELAQFLEFERSGYPTDGTASRWIDLTGRWADDDRKQFFSAPLSQIEAGADAARTSLGALQGGGGFAGDYAVIASRNHDQQISSQASVLARMSAVSNRVVSAAYDMVLAIYHELLFSQLQESLFATVQRDVDAAMTQSSGSALTKIARVSDRLREGDSEAVSQGLTTCRRLIDACADHLFASRDETFTVDGQPLQVGNPHVLNRLQAFAFVTGASKDRRTRLRRSLSDLYSRCSAATHGEVTVEEARFVFLQTYVILGEILTLDKSSPGDPDR